MPAGWGEEERFAAEVEYGPGVGDGGAEDLARELELVALLRSAGPALSPALADRSRAKERLMAAFAAQHSSAQHPSAQHPSPQHSSAQHSSAQHVGQADDTGPLAVVAPVTLASQPEERHAESTPLRPRRGGRHAAPEPDTPATDDDLGPDVRRLGRNRPDRPGHRRAALLGAAAAAALVALAGTGTFASRDALPGDPMYGIKRVAESTGYALTFGEQAKARRHLEQAQRRLDEVEGMVTRDQAMRPGGAAVDTAEHDLVRATMQEFDTDASEGSRLLLAGPEGAAQVDDVRQWAVEQSARLSGMRTAMPAQDKADESLALLGRLLDETAAAQAPCDPALGPCPTVPVDGPLDGAEEAGQVPDGVVPRGQEPARTTTSGGDGNAPADDAADDAPADDERATSPGSADGGGSDDGDRGRSRGSSGSGGGGDAAGSDDQVSVPLPLPAPVNVPSIGGLPGASLGG